MATCKRCGASIDFVESLEKKLIPVDHKRFKVVTKHGEVIEGRESHFASCGKRPEVAPKTADAVYFERFTGYEAAWGKLTLTPSAEHPGGWEARTTVAPEVRTVATSKAQAVVMSLSAAIGAVTERLELAARAP